MPANASAMTPEAQPPHRSYESADPHLGRILAVAALVILFVLGGLLVSAILQQAWARHLPIDTARKFIIAPDESPLTRFPQPTLQIDPRLDLLAVRRREEAELNTYGWIDRTNGIVRIPIERAMTLYQQGAASETNAASRKAPRSPLQLIQERATKR